MYRRNFLKTAFWLTTGTLFNSCSKYFNSFSGEQPNILFCIADDASYPHMGIYGTSWIKTPGFNRVAKEGILFNRAYTPNAKCAPSRACILTGRNSWQLEEAANHWCYFPSKFKTVFEALSENNYHVGYTAKGMAPAIPGEIDGKERELTGKKYNSRVLLPPTKFISPIDYAGNFEDFLNNKPANKPFCFWYGSNEPHRRYEYGTGIDKGGKKIEDIDHVYEFWPDNKTIRTDMLDYAYEIEYFDSHLQKMLALLEERNELKNTLIIVTSDNGMPFPRIKGQEYEYSNHMPLAMMWINGINEPGRVLDDYVSFIDFTPTFLEIAGVSAEQTDMQPITGRSLTNLFQSSKSGFIDPERDHILIGKERHDVGRPHDQGYPIRGIIKEDFLYLINFEPERWPAGNPETGYLNCDGSPTKTEILNQHRSGQDDLPWQSSFGKRPREELYYIKTDRECIHNLIDNTDLKSLKEKLHIQILDELKAQGDPRVFGNGSIFESYPYANKKSSNFYERFMAGKKTEANWINQSDFESK